MNRAIEDSLLHAYLDDELELEDRRRVEDAVKVSPALRSREAELRAADIALRDTLRPALEGPMPELRLPAVRAESRQSWTARLLDRFLQRGRASASIDNMHELQVRPVFATLLAFVAGGVVSATLFYGSGRDQLPATSTVSVHAQRLDHALESQPSGTTVSWRNPDGAESGEVTPVRTYKTDAGQYCREFDEQRSRAGAATASYGVACRESAGGWRVRMRVYP